MREAKSHPSMRISTQLKVNGVLVLLPSDVSITLVLFIIVIASVWVTVASLGSATLVQRNWLQGRQSAALENE